MTLLLPTARELHVALALVVALPALALAALGISIIARRVPSEAAIARGVSWAIGLSTLLSLALGWAWIGLGGRAVEVHLGAWFAVAGHEVLDDPEAAMRLPKLMQEQRDLIEIAARAIGAQRSRVAAAEREYLLGEADRLEGPVAAARAELDRHNARTYELLRMLEQHEGPFVPKRELDLEIERTVSLGPRVIELTKSEVLGNRIAELGRPVFILRELADGRDPSAVVAGWGLRSEDVYPVCVWGPDALIPAPAYQRRVAAE